MLKKIKLLKMSLITSCLIVPVGLTPLIISCSNSDWKKYIIDFYDEKYNDMNNLNYLDMYEYSYGLNLRDSEKWKVLHNNTMRFGNIFFAEWRDSLSCHDWDFSQPTDIRDLKCNSERQALHLYLNAGGGFWNKKLHSNLVPTDEVSNGDLFKYGFIGNNHPRPPKQLTPINANNGLTRGEDYQYIDSALEKSVAPINFSVYHGIEAIETMIYEQLEPFIINNNYLMCVGKTFKSYGWISTTTNRRLAVEYSGFGKNELFPTPIIFKINIKKGTTGVASVSSFPFMYDILNYDLQVMIARNKSYKVTKWFSIQEFGINVNVLEMELV